MSLRLSERAVPERLISRTLNVSLSDQKCQISAASREGGHETPATVVSHRRRGSAAMEAACTHKSTATTYALRHRAQNDPFIHDEDAPSQILTEISRPSKRNQTKTSSGKQRGVNNAPGSPTAARGNEWEASDYGIFYDDSKYDYMQHLRELGGGVWKEAAPKKQERAQHSLEDALRNASLDDDMRSVGGESYGGQSLSRQSYGGQSWTTSSFASRSGPYSDERTAYQSQQDVPDALAGFQPDMDPRLREVLEALDDDAYVDDEDEDVFDALAERPTKPRVVQTPPTTTTDDDQSLQPQPAVVDPVDTSQPPDHTAAPPDSAADGAWLEAFAKSKAATSGDTIAPKAVAVNRVFLQHPETSSMISAASQLGRRKKRKGALTSSTGFSMTSSVLARTEALSTLDARFDKIAEDYMEDGDDEELDDTASGITGMTGKSRMSAFGGSRFGGSQFGGSRFGGSRYDGSQYGGSQMSEAPSLVDDSSFNSMLDDFLGPRAGTKPKRGKRGGVGGSSGYLPQTGMQQLDEIRGGLGRRSCGRRLERRRETLVAANPPEHTSYVSVL
ncbi:hypothetical protein MRB53_038036 [Persea americana]|nr:hypothetical protein MRB53_038036 [Persea americana]